MIEQVMVDKWGDPWRVVCDFRVFGVPRPGGSKRAVRNKHTGKIMMIDASKHVATWRQDVKAAAMEAWPGELIGEEIYLDVTYGLLRPKGHYGTGRNSAILKDSAPKYPHGTPDLGKLDRSTEDALTGTIYTDDKQIVGHRTDKQYLAAGERPGAFVKVMVRK